ncbi:DNA glycosylase [Candidatus Chlorohelix sp.]|uniref:DNA-3-methyladenine glycosylase family protein n=1 Tax=Candidatus Chlorohelix sp. TaxID=3139201 RepID=UPI0030755BD2
MELAYFETEHLNLEYTLECGQTFRWKKMADGFYYGVMGNTFARLQQSGKRIYYETAPQQDDFETLAAYFRLEEDEQYREITRRISVDPFIERAVKQYYGLRLLRQPVFETLISFILSANNNIPKVARAVQAISKKYGQAITLGKYRGYAFPIADILGEVKQAELEQEEGIEYRAKYVLQTSKQVAAQGGNLDKLDELPYDWAVGQLMAFPGVGRTVADCVMLFSLGKYEAFPLDSWVQRAMEAAYFEGKKTQPRDIYLRAAQKWGEFAGYANEFIYMNARNKV